MGRLEGCELWGSLGGGVFSFQGGDPTLSSCTIRDHALGAALSGSGCGVWVGSNTQGKATLEAGNVFARNAGGDVVIK